MRGFHPHVMYMVELQFKDLNYFYLCTALTDFDVRAIGKYSPHPIFELGLQSISQSHENRCQDLMS